MGKKTMRLVENGARRYQQRRYRSIDQAWINRREQRIMATLLADCHLADGLLLDVPCGYGRFGPLMANLGITAVGADESHDMIQLVVENHRQHYQGRWLCANIFDLPFADNTFDAVLCIRLFHHRYSTAERQQMLAELARVSCRFVLLSFYRFAPLHVFLRHLRGTRGRLEILSFSRFQNLVQTSGLQILRVHPLLKFCHAQTFVVLKVENALPRARATSPTDAFQQQKV
jgi:ubiquinone/menaquinone biosynthesis C-methylase UbiE